MVRPNLKGAGKKRDKIPELRAQSIKYRMWAFLKKFWFFIQLHVIAVKWELIELFTRHRKFSVLEDVPHRAGEVIVITGGSRGIGSEVVKKMLQCGKHVIIGCRNTSEGNRLIRSIRSERITSGSAECLHLELTSLVSVRDFAHKILSKNTPIHVLINNAGIMFAPWYVTSDGFESHFQVNYLSHFLLTNLLLPRLVSSALFSSSRERCGRIVNVSSCAHYGGSINFSDLQMRELYSPYKAYMNTKLMQVMSSNYLDQKLRVQGINVRCVSVHPAVADTELYEHVQWIQIAKPLIKPFYRSAEQAADGVAYAALSPKIENQGGIFLANCQRWRQQKTAINPEIQQKLWRISCQLVGLKENEALKVDSSK